ncbi:TPR domain protein [Candidatus Burkholderia verschuerenii]|uniref:TPR domain protein n=1 Tax=Candidatus Burkholderia verschuerenii TaxID=242163 RepID=A0A0L0MEI0_9BURK|nr:tetratricopeptide repeat protein [Candidatus Burkholderia verschuerenii]KND61077.1 TPR domain protein [Candidatus Burkholderia verschuerenii]
MNPFVKKLFAKRQAGSTQLFAMPMSRIAGAVAFALAALAFALAYAQDPDSSPVPANDDQAAAQNAADLLTAPVAGDEKQDLPNVAMSSQIVFQVLAAEVALQRGQPAPAFQTYLALARDTKDPRFAQRATEIAIAAQSPNDALTSAQLWQQFAPHSERAAQLSASLKIVGGKPEDAKPILQRELAKVAPEQRGDAILSLQALLARGPNRVGGLNVLKDLIANDQNLPKAQLALGRQQLLADDQPGAKASLEKALQLKPDYLPAALTLARMGLEERKEGIASFEQYLSKNPKSRDARLALAQLYLSADRLDDAQKQFEIMRKNDSKDLPPIMALALINIQKKQFDKAQTYLNEYAKVAQNTPGADPGQAYIYLAQMALEQKQDDVAGQWLDRVPRSSQQYLPAQITRAQIMARQGKVDEARGLINSLQSSDPRDLALLARTDSAILFEAHRYQEAKSNLEKATHAFPDDPDLIYDYAMAAEKNGHYDVMETQLRTLMKMQPDNPQAYNALGYSLVDRNQRLDEAVKLIEKAVSLAPNDAFIMDSLGWARFRQGNAVEAEKILKNAYNLQPNAEIGAHLGEVQWKSGQQDQARATFRQAQKLEPDNDTLVKTLKRLQVNDL